VRAFVFYNSFNHWGWLDSCPEALKSELDVFAGDIRDANGVKTAMTGCDAVFHLAALIGIPFSYHSPDSYVDTNIKGTLNILQAARQLNTERVFITSTSEVYGTATFIPVTEDHPTQGQSPYSASKIAADSIAESFLRSFNLPVTIVRPFNTYGPRQSARAIIPTIITQLQSGCAQVKIGNLTPTRDFVFVEDTVSGFLEIANSTATIGEHINIATNSEVSVGELGRTLIGMINPDATMVQEPERFRPESSEVQRLCGSNEKLKRLTEWKQRYTLARGLANTVDWFKDRENLNKYKPGRYNV
jgi:NAD dependent epimerase/dehydratase